MAPKQPVPCEYLLDDAQLRAVGCLALESSDLDLTLTGIIAKICNFDEAAHHLFLGNLMMGKKFRLLRDLLNARVKVKSERNEVLALMDELEPLISVRNVAIHGIWGTPEQMMEALATGNRPSDVSAQSKRMGKKIKASELMDAARKISKLRLDLFFWCHKFDFDE